MSDVKPKIKLSINILCMYFFIWSLPLCAIILNIIQNRDIFDMSVLITFILGFVINLIWDFVLILLQKKEYHKRYL